MMDDLPPGGLDTLTEGLKELIDDSPPGGEVTFTEGLKGRLSTNSLPERYRLVD